MPLPTQAIVDPHLLPSIPAPSRKQAESLVRSWGFGTVFTWRDGPGAYYPPHMHSGLTTHVILSGEMTVSFPDDDEPRKETYGVGARVDVDAGRRHEVWMGEGGCGYVIGE
ncbi:hypothetical protein MMC10_001489 [Thelotrema lepadinum]|nr:hypothetical protein [Thelotrema lepadinum]